jgi:hypothetical protein
VFKLLSHALLALPSQLPVLPVQLSAHFPLLQSLPTQSEGIKQV